MHQTVIESFARWSLAVLTLLCLTGSVASSLRVWPHSLAYFNEGAGGPENGWRHMLGSNFDWGQDYLFLKRWLALHPDAVVSDTLETQFYDVRAIGVPLLTGRALPFTELPEQSEAGCRVYRIHEACKHAWQLDEVVSNAERIGVSFVGVYAEPGE